MKIVHCCLSNFYIDGFSYQENELVAENVKDGHDVTVIASTETFGTDRRLAYLEPGEYLGTDGAKVIRLPYRSFLPQVVMRKLRIHQGVFELLTVLQPDVIFFHGTCGWELNTVARYRRLNPRIKLYVDSHEDFHNSARTWGSKWVLHYSYYRNIIRKCLPQIDKILCITVETIEFVRDFYGVDSSLLELYPLGGQIFDDEEYETIRNTERTRLGLDEKDIVFVQSGKLDKSKKLPDGLRAFTNNTDARLRYLIAGQMYSEVHIEAQPLIDADARIQVLGWMSPEELRRILCAADIFVQPFGQTATTQMSLCCRCAIIVQDLASHRALWCENGFLINERDGLGTAFSYMLNNAGRLLSMQQASGEFAKRYLDYSVLARRICG